VFLQARHARQVARRPAGREVLDRALLIGQKQQHVHARDLRRRRRAGLWPRRGRRRGGGAPAEQDPGSDDGRRLQQVAAGDPLPVDLAITHVRAVTS